MSDRLAKARQIRRAMQLMALSISDESKMLEIADIYPVWTGNSQGYAEGDVVSYGKDENGETRLYKVITAHISQSSWMPDAAPSLFKRIGFDTNGVAIWTRPLGDFDAYAKGDRVSHNGIIWVSDIDANVWEPGIYGWTEEQA